MQWLVLCVAAGAKDMLPCWRCQQVVDFAGEGGSSSHVRDPACTCLTLPARAFCSHTSPACTGRV
jgi:hypothetical protein